MIGLVRFVTGVVALIAGAMRGQPKERATAARNAVPAGAVPDSCQTCRFWSPDSGDRTGYCDQEKTHMSSRYPCRHWRRKKRGDWRC